MSGNEKLLFKGHVIKPGDFVKATDAHSGAVTFYRVVRVWGSHGVFRVITEEEAGPNPIQNRGPTGGPRLDTMIDAR